MTRTEILTQICQTTNKTLPPNTDSVTQARLINYMNDGQRTLLTKPGIRRLRDATVTFASVASQPTYVLPNIAKISRMFETTNDRTLYEMSQQDWRLIQPDTTITGTPEAFVWTGRQAVAVQPADASALFVVSSSASDTTQTVYVEGIITGGYPFSVSVTITGTTAVNVSAALTAAIRVDKFYLSAACVGTVTLTEDSGGGATLAVIPIGSTVTYYDGFALWPTPSAIITYYVDLQRAVTDFASATDVPLLPDDFHDLIVTYAICEEFKHTKDDRWPIYAKEFKDRTGDLLYWLSESAIGRPRGLMGVWQRPSQLGSWYPAGS